MAIIRGCTCTLFLAASALLLSLPACSGDGGKDGAQFSIVCEESGLCECVDNSQCSANEVCINGWCEQLGPPVEDLVLQDGIDSWYLDSVFDAAIEPGAFKSPCESNEDCDSLMCLELSPTEGICTQTCIDQCPPGWECRGVSQDEFLTFFCFPEEDRLCQPCKTDVGCTGEMNLCVDVGGVPSCGRDCSAVSCPNGYVCEETTSVEGTVGLQCVPENGYCQCTPETIGELFLCTTDNEYGSCPGQRVCQDDGSMSDCNAKSASPEVCDGEDNDCDGFVDEDIPGKPCTNENDHGVCNGEVLCIAGFGEVCNASEAAPELCDNLDNDCDGETDEEFKDDDGLYSLIEHCGACSVGCVGLFANAAEVICDTSGDSPECRIELCEPGYIPAAGNLCLPAIHHLCEPCTSHEACVGNEDKCIAVNPTDTQTFCGRDCSEGNQYGADCPQGYACESVLLEDGEFQQCVPENNSCDCTELNAGQEKPCTTQNDFGSCYGIAACDPDQGWLGCTAIAPEEEVCDGVDNNCDGIIDEGLSGGSCINGNAFGTCIGTVTCTGADGQFCSAPTPEEEICDGVDNDCDGETDEPFATNVVDEEGTVVALVYDLGNENCGGCGLPCQPTAPVTDVQCHSQGTEVECKVEACEPGYYPSEGKVCLPIPNKNLCLPCAEDSDCLGPADLCLDYPQGAFCGRDCSPGSIYSIGEEGDDQFCNGAEGEQGCCPDAYLCIDGQCSRESQDCDCDVEGKLRSCEVANEVGVCAGVEVCTVSGPDAGWQPCDALVPQPEVCDGVDNDCDGLLDGFDDSVDTEGLDGYPQCQNVSDFCTGSWTCAEVEGKFEWYCTAEVPSNESCNGLDDDCDGEVDEGFTDANGQLTLLAHCGQCGLDCTEALTNLATTGNGNVLDGAVACELQGGLPTCVPKQCASGFYPFPSAGPATVCLGLDAANCQPCAEAGDCSSIGHGCLSVGTDDGLYCAQRCDDESPHPACTGNPGQQGCCPSGFSCEPVNGQPPGQLFCRPLSDSCQCNEENVGLERPCTADGDGGQITCFGISACAQLGGGLYGWGPCDTSANVEICDGSDNDCDGVVDEGFMVGGQYATDEHCGACGNNCALKWSPSEQHVLGECDPGLPGGPDCVVGECLTAVVDGTTYQYVDLDDWTGNGCECPAAVDLDLDEPEVFPAYPLPGAEYLDADCDGIDGDLETAIFVSAGAEGGDGSLGSPLGTIQDAVDLFAPAIHSHILVTTGSYPERVTVKNGVKMFGGYSPDFFIRDVALFPTIIDGPLPDFADPIQVPGAVVAVGISQPTVIVGFTINGYDVPAGGESAGQPSIAVYVSGSSSALKLLNNRVVGGQGGPGLPGANGLAGSSGEPGHDGAHSAECAEGVNCTAWPCNVKTCSGHEQPGGTGGANLSCAGSGGCPGMESQGGENVQVANAPQPGCMYAAGGHQGTYSGGPWHLCKYDCFINGQMNGPNGGDGTDGSGGWAGAGSADSFGNVVNGQWVGSGGVSGTAGSTGGGGQGGSAGAYVQNSKSNNCTVGNPAGDLGGSGGGGGAGGCGGNAGLGGQPGGAGMGVFIASGAGGSFVDIKGNVILRGRGGNGGAGGNGGTGGKGGEGGSGGSAGWPAWCAGVGGAGGRGGDGGPGGGGGGGSGGPALGLAVVGGSIVPFANNNEFPVPDGDSGGGNGGKGGLSVDPNNSGGDGVDGGSMGVRGY